MICGEDWEAGLYQNEQLNPYLVRSGKLDLQQKKPQTPQNPTRQKKPGDGGRWGRQIQHYMVESGGEKNREQKRHSKWSGFK